MGDSAAALAVVDVFVTQYPKTIAARLLASDAALAGQQWDRAGGLLDGVRAALGDRNATVLNNMGWVRSNQNRGGDAVALARAAYVLNPNSPPVTASYGWFAHNAGDRAVAVALLEKAVSLAPDITAYRERLAKAQNGR